MEQTPFATQYGSMLAESTSPETLGHGLKEEGWQDTNWLLSVKRQASMFDLHHTERHERILIYPASQADTEADQVLTHSQVPHLPVVYRGDQLAVAQLPWLLQPLTQWELPAESYSTDQFTLGNAAEEIASFLATVWTKTRTRPPVFTLEQFALSREGGPVAPIPPIELVPNDDWIALEEGFMVALSSSYDRQSIHAARAQFHQTFQEIIDHGNFR